MRCPDCNKFVPFDDTTDPEVNLDITQPTSPDDNTAGISGDVRIVLTCAECGTELKEATLEVDVEVEIPLRPPDGTEWVKDSEWELDSDSAENDQRTEGKGRGTKTFYGATLSGHLIRTYTGPDVIGQFDKVAVPFEWSDSVQASNMDEMV